MMVITIKVDKELDQISRKQTMKRTPKFRKTVVSLHPVWVVKCSSDTASDDTMQVGLIIHCTDGNLLVGRFVVNHVYDIKQPLVKKVMFCVDVMTGLWHCYHKGLTGLYSIENDNSNSS